MPTVATNNSAGTNPQQIAGQMGALSINQSHSENQSQPEDLWIPIEFNPFANLHPSHVAGKSRHLPDLISIERIESTDRVDGQTPASNQQPWRQNYRLNTKSMIAALPSDSIPVAMDCTFINDKPLICIADRFRIHCYTMEEYSHFIDLPALPVDQRELQIWEEALSAASGTVDFTGVYQKLKQLALSRGGDAEGMSAIHLTPLSLRFGSNQPCTLTQLQNQSDEITCMAVLQRYEIDDKPPGVLVVGTDFGRLLIVNPSASNETVSSKCHQLPCGIDCLSVWGLHDVDYHVAVLGSDNAIHLFDGSNCNRLIQLNYSVVSLLAEQRTLYVAAANNSFAEYDLTLKGKRVFELRMPERISCMKRFRYRQRNVEGVMLALASGVVRIYARRQLVSELQCEEPLLSLSFGHYKQEDNCVLGVTLSGGLVVHALRNAAALSARELATGPPEEQGLPLPVPRKTRMYVDQRSREQQGSLEMHRRFQRDLQMLRLNVLRAYKRSKEKALNPISAPAEKLTNFWLKPPASSTDNSEAEESLKMNAELFGLGPQFEVRLVLEAVGSMPMTGLMLLCRRQLPTTGGTRNLQPLVISPDIQRLPVLIPGYQYRFKIGLSFDTAKDNQQQQAQALFTSVSSTVIVQALQFPSQQPPAQLEQFQNQISIKSTVTADNNAATVRGSVLISTAIELPPFIIA